MSFWVYILRCADGSYYTGHTDNLEHRTQQHHAGAITSCYTYKRRPLQLVFSQDFATREEALASEQQIKGWSRKKKEAMMRGDWAEVSRLAKSKSVQAELVEAKAEHSATVHPEPAEGQAHHDRRTSAVRPELVEGQEQTPVFIEAQWPSIHPSTSSGRTDGEALCDEGRL